MKIRTDDLPSAIVLRAAAAVWGEMLNRLPTPDQYEAAWLALERAAIAHARAKVLR